MAIEDKRSLVRLGEGAFYVPISHLELDGLVGRLMQICDIMGDSTQREAVKSEIKQRTRGWLNSEYDYLGYKEPITKEDLLELSKKSTVIQSRIILNKPKD